MIETLIIAAIIVAGWYWFEGRWDRKLFAAEPGRTCINFKASEARAFLAAHPETQVLDVRSDAEVAKGTLPHAIHISFGDAAFDNKVSALDVTKPILVYCAGGYRSRKAVERLKPLGFQHIVHLHRGYMSWKE